MTLVWIAVALAFAVIEVASVALFAGFLAVGAIGAAIAAFVGLDPIAQGIVFAVVSMAGVGLVRRPILAYLKNRHHPDTQSGAWAMIGQTAIVVDPILDGQHRGHVRIAGEDWPALTADGSPAAQGATVRIVDIKRATLVVDRNQ